MEPNIAQETVKILAEQGEILLPEDLSSQDFEACYAALKQLNDRSKVDMDAVRLDFFSKDTERIKQRLVALQQILRTGCAHKLVVSTMYLLKHLELRGASNGDILADQFVSDLIAFSISIHTAEHRAQTHTAPPPEYNSEALRQNLLNQLNQALAAFDDEESLRIITQLEKNKPQEQLKTLATMRTHVKEFAFDKAISALSQLTSTSLNQATGRRKPVVLAVDDVPSNLTALKSILGDQYKFVGVTSGRAVLQYIENNIPDVYILDIDMPEMNGFEVAEQIRRRRKIAPIVFLTANSTMEYVIRAFEMGITDFLVKPCSRQAVLAKLEILTLR
ncbi:MAG: response regulator [Thermoguttaceae bacterium]